MKGYAKYRRADLKKLTKTQRDILLDCCLHERFSYVHGAKIGYYLSTFKTSASQKQIEDELAELVAGGYLAEQNGIYGAADHESLNDLKRSLWWPLALDRGKTIMQRLWRFLLANAVQVGVGVIIGYIIAFLTR